MCVASLRANIICIHTRRQSCEGWLESGECFTGACNAKRFKKMSGDALNIPRLLKVLCDVKYWRTLHQVAATYYCKRRCEVQTLESNAQLRFNRPKQMVCQPNSTPSEPQPVLLDSDTIIIKFGIAVFERATENIYALNTCRAAKLICPVSPAICLHAESNIFHAFGPDSRRKISDKFVLFARTFKLVFGNALSYVLVCLSDRVACCGRHATLGVLFCV